MCSLCSTQGRSANPCWQQLASLYTKTEGLTCACAAGMQRTAWDGSSPTCGTLPARTLRRPVVRSARRCAACLLVVSCDMHACYMPACNLQASGRSFMPVACLRDCYPMVLSHVRRAERDLTHAAASRREHWRPVHTPPRGGSLQDC